MAEKARVVLDCCADQGGGIFDELFRNASAAEESFGQAARLKESINANRTRTEMVNRLKPERFSEVAIDEGVAVKHRLREIRRYEVAPIEGGGSNIRIAEAALAH